MSGDPLPRLRALCLALPEATERPSHGEPTWFVRDKRVFVTYAGAHHDDRVGFWCPAPPGVAEGLVAAEPERFFVPPYVGGRGWLGVRLDVPVDWERVADLVEEAYRCVAPKALVARLDAEGAAAVGPSGAGGVDWRTSGVRVVLPDALDTDTPQTPGMARAAALTTRTGADRLWAGTVDIEPHARTGAHHHGELESVIYVLSGRARMRWGERLEYVAEAGPGAFVLVPPWVPHQEINAGDEVLRCVLVRSGQEPVVVNLDVEAADEPEPVTWVDPHHPPPRA